MSKKVQYIILNGPPSSGKTTIARELTRELVARVGASGVVQDSFSAPMRHFFAVALGEKYNIMNRERAMPELNGRSIRQSLIHLAEEYLKEQYGRDCFGRWLVHRTLRNPDRLPTFVIVDDGGYGENEQACPNRYIVQVIRPGHDFRNDSRKYLVPNYTLVNDGNTVQLYLKVSELAEIIHAKH